MAAVERLQDPTLLTRWIDPGSMQLRRDVHYEFAPGIDLDKAMIEAILAKNGIPTSISEADVEFFKHRRLANRLFQEWKYKPDVRAAVVANVNTVMTERGFGPDEWEKGFIEHYAKLINEGQTTVPDLVKKLTPYFNWCIVYIEEVYGPLL
jgi:hypothetical protein